MLSMTNLPDEDVMYYTKDMWRWVVSLQSDVLLLNNIIIIILFYFEYYFWYKLTHCLKNNSVSSATFVIPNVWWRDLWKEKEKQSKWYFFVHFKHSFLDRNLIHTWDDEWYRTVHHSLFAFQVQTKIITKTILYSNMFNGMEYCKTPVTLMQDCAFLRVDEYKWTFCKLNWTTWTALVRSKRPLFIKCFVRKNKTILTVNRNIIYK